ncbi:SprB repeat-containing protein [Myxococcota bacterium]|nr:SprB repeat-containing protein [Myxococcota bacterium]
MKASRLALIGIATTSYLFLCGNQSSCDRRVPTLTCDLTPQLSVAPGTCAPLGNPCVDHVWSSLPAIDGFTLCDAPAGITITTQHSTTGTTRSVCASADVAELTGQPINFIFGRGNEIGRGQIIVSTVEPLVVSAVATPATIDAGATTQLSVSVSGGTPPYSFAWSPADGLSALDISNPIASPAQSMVYSVVVSDAVGAIMNASVAVTVRQVLLVTASPSVIPPGIGAFSQLYADGPAGTPPYTYSWSSSETLSDGTAQDPFAFPESTTTYHVTRTDAAGVALEGHVTLFVQIEARVFASPTQIAAGQATQLSVFAQGGSGTFTYRWVTPRPQDMPENPSAAFTLARPTATAYYTVIVTDGLGAQATATVQVVVSASGPTPELTAMFNFSFNGVESLTLDASASRSVGGVITSYEWDFSWFPNSPDLVLGSPLAFSSVTATTVGTITLTVRDSLGRVATYSLPFP